MNKNRNYHPIKINFTDEEYELISKFSAECGITKVELCRMLLKGYQPKLLMDESQNIFLERLYMRHRFEKEESIKSILEKIILDFENFCRLPEKVRRDSNGNNQSLGD